MQTTSIRSLYLNEELQKEGTLKVAGWVRTVRDSKTFGFIELNDGTFFKSLQIVFEDGLENFKEIAKLGVGSAIIVEGNLVLTPNQKQPFELKATKIEVEGESPADYPLQKKRHSFEFLRQIAHLRPRTNTFCAVLEYVLLQLMQFINSSKKEVSYMHIHHLLQQVTVKVQEKCLE